MSQAMNNSKEVDTQKIEAQISGLKNVTRLAQNTLNLVNDTEVKGAYAMAVVEIQQWLNEILKTIDTQQKALESALPKVEVPEANKLPVKLLDEPVPGSEGAR